MIENPLKSRNTLNVFQNSRGMQTHIGQNRILPKIKCEKF